MQCVVCSFVCTHTLGTGVNSLKHGMCTYLQVAQVRGVLHTSHAPDQATASPLGRDEQAGALKRLLSSCLGQRAGASFYVSGLPGTGTALQGLPPGLLCKLIHTRLHEPTIEFYNAMPALLLWVAWGCGKAVVWVVAQRRCGLFRAF